MKKKIKNILLIFAGVGIGAGIGAVSVARNSAKETMKWKELSDKHLALMRLLNQWMITKQEGKSIVEYLKKENIKSIAIYGMSYVGERLYDELENSDIDIKFAIDKNAENIYSDIEIVTPEVSIEDVDAIIVTPVFYFNEIEEKLHKKTSSVILSLEDILYTM